MQMATQSLYKYRSWIPENWHFENIAKDGIKFSVILTNKYEVKAKIFIIWISVYSN